MNSQPRKLRGPRTIESQAAPVDEQHLGASQRQLLTPPPSQDEVNNSRLASSLSPPPVTSVDPGPSVTSKAKGKQQARKSTTKTLEHEINDLQSPATVRNSNARLSAATEAILAKSRKRSRTSQATSSQAAPPASFESTVSNDSSHPRKKARKSNSNDLDNSTADVPSTTKRTRSSHARSGSQANSPNPRAKKALKLSPPTKEKADVKVSPSAKASTGAKKKGYRQTPPLRLPLPKPKIDLDAPQPPASPSDDPILLVGSSPSFNVSSKRDHLPRRTPSSSLLPKLSRKLATARPEPELEHANEVEFGRVEDDGFFDAPDDDSNGGFDERDMRLGLGLGPEFIIPLRPETPSPQVLTRRKSDLDDRILTPYRDPLLNEQPIAGPSTQPSSRGEIDQQSRKSAVSMSFAELDKSGDGFDADGDQFDFHLDPSASRSPRHTPVPEQADHSFVSNHSHTSDSQSEVETSRSTTQQDNFELTPSRNDSVWTHNRTGSATREEASQEVEDFNLDDWVDTRHVSPRHVSPRNNQEEEKEEDAQEEQLVERERSLSVQRDPEHVYEPGSPGSPCPAGAPPTFGAAFNASSSVIDEEEEVEVAEEEEEEEEADVDVEDDASSFDNSNEKITEMWSPDARASQYESPRTRRPFSVGGEDEDDLGDDDEDDDEAPLVEITSRDPRAAARAAAILKMHHNYVQEGFEKSFSRRKSSSSRSRRQSMANASTLSIPELMEEAELEILSQSQIRRTSSPFDTPGRGNFEGISGAWTPGWNGDGNSRAPAAASTPYIASRPEKNPLVPGRWGKIEWRHLERCFVYERRALAQEMGYASSKDVGPEVVDLDEVVGRFVEGVADDELEGEWAWEKLRLRAFALQTRIKNEGYNPRSPTPADFSRRLASATPSSIRNVSIDPPSQSMPNLPASLLAPRYTHLREEATPLTSSSSQPLPRSNARKGDMPPPALPGRQKNVQIPSLAKPIAPATPSTNRFLGFLGSVWNRGSRSPQHQRQAEPQPQPQSQMPRLPFEANPDLRHVPTPKASRAPAPRPLKKYNLNPTVARPIEINNDPLRRKSSSGSVKDLVKSFEDIAEQKQMRARRPKELADAAQQRMANRRVRSLNSMREDDSSQGISR